jgi:hypothetical protein
MIDGLQRFLIFLTIIRLAFDVIDNEKKTHKIYCFGISNNQIKPCGMNPRIHGCYRFIKNLVL